MNSPAPLAAILLATLLTAAGCAPAHTVTPAERASALLSSQPPPPGRVCRIDPTPDVLPPVDLLLDTRALTDDLAALPLEGREASGYAILSMGYDPFGSNIRRVMIENDLRAETADSIQKLVFHHRRTVGRAEREWGVRLRIDLDDPARLTVGRQERCAPRPRDSLMALAMETTFGSGVRNRGGYRESTVWVRLMINPSGSVAGAAVERGLVSGVGMEQRIFDYVRSLFFDPALEDGQPVPGMVSVPLVLRER
jgi:hypothetical protein